MPTVYGYVRVSTVEQAEEGVSVAAQEGAVRRDYEYRWQDQGGWGGVEVDKGVSGSKEFLSRRGGAALLGKSSRGDVILFPKLDRGFRDTADLLETIRVFDALGVRLVFL